MDLNRALDVVLAQVAELFGLRSGWIFLIHEQTGETYLAASHNLPLGLSDEPALMSGSCYCLDTYYAGDLDGAANVNIITCSRLKKLVQGSEGLRYHASIPLYRSPPPDEIGLQTGQDSSGQITDSAQTADAKQKLGVLNVASTDWRELSDGDLQLLYTVGDLLSIAIERAQLFDQRAHLGAAEERNRLAREIHDTLAQGLSAIALQLEVADALLDGDVDPTQLRKHVRQALELTRYNLDEARRSVMDLRAAPLEGRTLAEALAVLTESISTDCVELIQFVLEGDNRPLPLHLEVGLYRIAQEAINNAIRHAHAAQIDVKLTFFPEQVKLMVHDDGQGFQCDHPPKDHFGLVGLTERTKLLGGHMDLHSSHGSGTTVTVVVPLRNKRL